jgi:hypothetical protein
MQVPAGLEAQIWAAELQMAMTLQTRVLMVLPVMVQQQMLFLMILRSILQPQTNHFLPMHRLTAVLHLIFLREKGIYQTFH